MNTFEHDQENSIGKENVDHHDGHDSNGQESTQDPLQVSLEQEKADEGQGEAAQQEEEHAQGQTKADQEENESVKDSAGTAQYAAVYHPPYQTSSSAAFGKTERGSGKRKGLGVALIATCLALSIFCGTVAGLLSSLFVGRLGDISLLGTSDGGITITKNDGSIKVNEVVGSTGDTNLSVPEVVSKVADTVVEVVTDVSAGSGVIIAKGGGHGYIVTNHHVIDGATQIGVRLSDGTEMMATLMDGDVSKDIAVIRIATSIDLSVAVFGKSSELCVGETVVAIGNPLGSFGGTVTDGIISATDRKINVQGIDMTLIQTNAAVNPGNSGGGLFNLAGELVGIVNAKQIAEGIEGLAFAIPVDDVYNMIVAIIEDGYLKGRASLGIEVIQLTADEARTYTGINKAGIYILGSSVSDLHERDLIYKIDQTEINTLSDYYAAINAVTVGEKVTVVVRRIVGFRQYEYTVSVTAKEYIPASMS